MRLTMIGRIMLNEKSVRSEKADNTLRFLHKYLILASFSRSLLYPRFFPLTHLGRENEANKLFIIIWLPVWGNRKQSAG